MSRNVSDRFRHDPSPEPGGEKPVRYATLLLSAVGALSGACGSSAGPTSPPGPHANYYVDASAGNDGRSEEHTSELQSQSNLVCRLLLEKKQQPHAVANAAPTA